MKDVFGNHAATYLLNSLNDLARAWKKGIYTDESITKGVGKLLEVIRNDKILMEHLQQMRNNAKSGHYEPLIEMFWANGKHPLHGTPFSKRYKAQTIL